MQARENWPRSAHDQGTLKPAQFELSRVPILLCGVKRKIQVANPECPLTGTKQLPER